MALRTNTDILPNSMMVENTLAAKYAYSFLIFSNTWLHPDSTFLTCIQAPFWSSFVICSSWLFLGPINWIAFAHLLPFLGEMQLYYYVASSITQNEGRTTVDFTSLLRPSETALKIRFAHVIIKKAVQGF